jgi:Fe-S cluster assembly ATP-binding protein
MLKIKNLTARIGEKRILSEINLEVNVGECLLITGHNGSGKSTLLHTLMARPDIESQGSIEFQGKDITSLECYERARLGFFIAHQSPPTLDGVNTASLFNEIAKIQDSETKKIDVIRKAKTIFKDLSLPEDWTRRDFNQGASGGERKKNELAQAKLMSPKVLLLDEPDSGLEQTSRSKILNLIKSVTQQNGIVLLVTHDKLLQEQFVNNKIELNNGKLS